MRKFFFLLLLFSCVCYSQNTIRGTILNNEGTPIQRASITISNIDSNEILEYDISDEQGNYSILLRSSVQQVKIQVRKLGFLTESKQIRNESQTINFSLAY